MLHRSNNDVKKSNLFGNGWCVSSKAALAGMTIGTVAIMGIVGLGSNDLTRRQLCGSTEEDPEQKLKNKQWEVKYAFQEILKTPPWINKRNWFNRNNDSRDSTDEVDEDKAGAGLVATGLWDKIYNHTESQLLNGNTEDNKAEYTKLIQDVRNSMRDIINEIEVSVEDLVKQAKAVILRHLTKEQNKRLTYLIYIINTHDTRELKSAEDSNARRFIDLWRAIAKCIADEQELQDTAIEAQKSHLDVRLKKMFGKTLEELKTKIPEITEKAREIHKIPEITEKAGEIHKTGRDGIRELPVFALQPSNEPRNDNP